MFRVRFWALVGMILTAALARLVPHLNNFTPVEAMALFGGAYFAHKVCAFLVPLAAMLLSDFVLMNTTYKSFDFFTVETLTLYGCFMLTVCIGLWLSRRKTALNVAGAALTSSVLFFLLTNFSVWASGSVGYPKTGAGLAECYTAAIPFFRNELLGTAVYTLVLFGGFALMERRFSQLREAEATA